MICAVNEDLLPHFLAALAPRDPLCVQLGAHVQAFGASPGSGWQFYTTARQQPPFALEVRGDTARCAGECDGEELGSFLRFVGVRQLFWQQQPPAGYREELPVRRFCLPAGGRLAGGQGGPPHGLVLDTQPAMGPVTGLVMENSAELAGQDFFDAFYASACALRNRGLAQIWALTRPDGIPAATCGAYALWEGRAYLSALHTRSDLRRQGVGSWLVCAQANFWAGQGSAVEFLCEELLAGYYEALGFCPAGTMRRHRMVETPAK